MVIKWKTLLKGFIWEAIGFIILFLIAWCTTGTAFKATITSITYAGFRAVTFYPYERLFKRVIRWYYYKTGQWCNVPAPIKSINKDNEHLKGEQ